MTDRGAGMGSRRKGQLNLMLNLTEFLEGAEDLEKPQLVLSPNLLPPKVLGQLEQLKKLDLLKDDVFMSLFAQAPIDPIGAYAALRKQFPHWKWEFEPVSCTVVTVLARQSGQTTAFMTLDLISDDLAVYVRKDNLLQKSLDIRAEDAFKHTKESNNFAWLERIIAKELGLVDIA